MRLAPNSYNDVNSHNYDVNNLTSYHRIMITSEFQKWTGIL